jgi:CheY-like chemotaxis protein
MDEETLARATEPFFTTKGVGKGTGLGLSMVQGMAEQCGGRFVLTSNVGKGATAEIWLPIAQAPSEVGPVGAETTQETPPVQAMRILAVDDDIIVLMNTAMILEDMGHQVLEASSGAAALEILRNEPEVDLLVTDFAMPGMTGGDLISAARALRANLPVILLSGYVDLPDGQEIDAERISKPFTETELARGIAIVTNRAS